MGIIEGMSNEMYHATAGISSSAVKAVYKKSLAHWKGEKRSQTAAFTMGTAIHSLLLEEDRDLVVKGPKTKASAAFKTMKEELTEDQVLLTEVEYNVANRIAKGALDNPTCKAALRHKDRRNEVSIFAQDPISGLMLKTRPDLMIESEQTVYDVKSTQDASPEGFARECVKYGYFLQGAHYVMVCQLAGFSTKEFSFIACEKQAPYISHLHVMGPEVMEWATAELHKTLAKIANANVTDKYGTGWGDYSILEKPKWL